MLILKKGQKIENYITFMKFTDPLYSIILWFSLSFQRRHIIVFKSTFKSIFKNTFHQLGWSVHTSMKRMIWTKLLMYEEGSFKKIAKKVW